MKACLWIYPEPPHRWFMSPSRECLQVVCLTVWALWLTRGEVS